MKFLLTLFSLLFISCATTPTVSRHIPNVEPVKPKEYVLDTSAVISLLRPAGGAGHACPCEGEIYTARHVIQPRDVKGNYILDSYYNTFTWEDGIGNIGEARGVAHNIYKDLGKLELHNHINKRFYSKATSIPKKDDKVFWQSYEPKSFAPKLRKSEVEFLFAGYVFFKDLPNPGDSGSCLFNEKGEVVGIVVWSVLRDTADYGVGVLLDIE
jgi:hypothetical protein